MQAAEAIQQAYAAIAKAEACLSFFLPASDVSRINETKPGQTIEVSEWTWQVLQKAVQLYRESAGAFDITIAPTLQRWGYLPRAGKTCGGRSRLGTQADLELLPNHRLHLRKAVRIDLGGIAKGFAVDRAIEALQNAGAEGGLVNAGGDLRVYGTPAATIHIRHPGSPGTLIPLTRLQNAAIATSAAYFSRKPWRGSWVTPLLNGTDRTACGQSMSVSVQAADCMTADALTKIVMALGERSAGILAAHSAIGYIATRTGEIVSTFPA